MFGGIFVPPAYAGTTTADFLKWERKSQDAFIHTSVGMITAIASKAKPKVARCLNDWYYEGNLETKRNSEIINKMPELLDFHPTTVVLAYVEGVCGRMQLD